MKLRARFNPFDGVWCTLSIGTERPPRLSARELILKAAATCQRRHARGLSVERHPLKTFKATSGCG